LETEVLKTEEALTQENIEDLVSKLNAVPTADELREKAEREMWAIFLEKEESDELPDKVVYEDLPGDSKRLVGLIEDGDEERPPWWLESFEWRIRERGSENAHQISASLLKDRIEGFHEDSHILSPKLIDQISDHLEALNGLGEKIKNEVRENDNGGTFEVFEEKRDEPQKGSGRGWDFAVPDTLFELKDDWIATSEEYKKWFDGLLRLVPPSNEALTAILLADSRINKDLASETLSDEIIETLETLGFTSRNKIKNSSISSKIEDSMELRGFFDLAVPYPEGYEDVEAPPLVTSFFVAFSEGVQTLNAEEQERIKSWMTRSAEHYTKSLTDSELRDFASVAHSIPVYLYPKRPTLKLGGRRYAKSNDTPGRYTDYAKAQSIRKICKRAGLIND